MKPKPTCEEVRSLAPEVALGNAPGDERALVLSHTRSCPECRRAMEEFSATADALLLLGPAQEPDSGFESKVLARMGAEQRPRRRLRPLLAAAAVASVVLTAAAGYWITAEDRRLARHYREALAVANGEYFGVVPARGPDGDRAGHLFAYQGDPAWVFLIFDQPLQPGSYEAELQTRSGDTRSLGTADIGAGDVTWGRDIPLRLRDVRAVRIVDDRGVTLVEATFPSR